VTSQDREFGERFEPHRRELQAHCYRMLGSLHDAEDLAQEALLRAWNRRHTFAGHSSFRTWLHRIATNACLDVLEQRPARALPAHLAPPSRLEDPMGPPREDPIWMTPAPDALLEIDPGPEARVSTRESVALAFLVALQTLPPRQRAVLLFRDVLGWQASEVAEAVEMSVAAVNSALQRARETLEATRRAQEGVMKPVLDESARTLLGQYIAAWEAADHSSLVALLHEEVTLAMPPLPTWYRGRHDVGGFLGGLLAGEARGRFRVLPTLANGQPALAFYQLDAQTGVYRPFSLQLLELAGGRIKGLLSFLDPRLPAQFGLPESLPPLH
jgi:RNA polymerase sigma-70 factor (ECF subfamily)